MAAEKNGQHNSITINHCRATTIVFCGRLDFMKAETKFCNVVHQRNLKTKLKVSIFVEYSLLKSANFNLHRSI